MSSSSSTRAGENRPTSREKDAEKDAELLEQAPDTIPELRGPIVTADGKREITEDECAMSLGYAWPELKKWGILTCIFAVQTSMNFNTSLYSNAIGGISEEFDVSEQNARAGAAVFLLTYAFGCELWAPWSEEFGRWPVLQLSMFLINLTQIPVGIAPNFATIMAFRALGGLCLAGGSVTLGMIADLWDGNHQQYAVAFVVFSSVGGSVLGPIVGGFCEQYLAWRWCIWIQLIFGVAVQIIHFFTPETRSTILMDRAAKKLRKDGVDPNVYGPGEITPIMERLDFHEIMETWGRAFVMFIKEPIVLSLSLLSGFSDALVFMFIQSFVLVYGDKYGFDSVQLGLAFIPLLLGYAIAYVSFIPAIERNKRQRAAHPEDERAQYESRLWWLLYTVPCLPIGLIGFAWTASGPPVHWVGSMVFAAIIGIANYSIYMATIDYMVHAYGPYAASATGGNGWSRDFLAGALTCGAPPFFENIGGDQHIEIATTILFAVSTVLVMAVYVIYWKGPQLRANSKFAQQLAASRKEEPGRRASVMPAPYGSRRNSRRASVAPGVASRNASVAAAANAQV